MLPYISVLIFCTSVYIYIGIFGANVHLYIYPQSIFTLKYCSCEFGCMTTTVYLHTKLCSCESIHVYVHSHIDPVNLSIPTARPMPESHDCFHFIDKPIRSPLTAARRHTGRGASRFLQHRYYHCVWELVRQVQADNTQA